MSECWTLKGNRDKRKQKEGSKWQEGGNERPRVERKVPTIELCYPLNIYIFFC